MLTWVCLQQICSRSRHVNLHVVCTRFGILHHSKVCHGRARLLGPAWELWCNARHMQNWTT